MNLTKASHMLTTSYFSGSINMMPSL
jgi:hypothetical protein